MDNEKAYAVDKAMRHRVKVECCGAYKGYDYICVLVKELGHRCGYVRLPTSHPFFGVDYDKIYEIRDVECHGGLTFSGKLGWLKDGYWIGFDCGHAGDGRVYDYMDSEKAKMWKRMEDFQDEIRSKDYVEEECRAIIDQVKQVWRIRSKLFWRKLKNLLLWR